MVLEEHTEVWDLLGLERPSATKSGSRWSGAKKSDGRHYRSAVWVAELRSSPSGCFGCDLSCPFRQRKAAESSEIKKEIDGDSGMPRPGVEEQYWLIVAAFAYRLRRGRCDHVPVMSR